ncbi:MAG: hypothetical protein ACLFTK_03885 [Anaerolineales bacterium]
MVDFLYEAHSGWRWILILGTVALAVFFAYALVTRQTTAPQETRALKLWAGIMDMQLLLGVLLAGVYILGLDEGRSWYSALIGHLTLGILAVVAAHTPAIYSRLNGDPTPQVRRIMGLALPVIVFITMWLGVAAIDRSLFST